MEASITAAATAVGDVIPHVATIGGAVLLVIAAVMTFKMVRRAF